MRDGGASAVEYALLLAGVAAVIVTAVLLFSSFVGEVLTQSCTTITDQTGPVDYECEP